MKLGLGIVICLASLVAGAGCGDASDPSAGSHAISAARHCTYRYASHHPKVRMLSENDYGMSDAIIGAVNGWAADDGCKTTTVWAGGQGYGHPNQGEFFIERRGWGRPVHDFVDVDRAGAIKITEAPLGVNAATWAQKRGNLRFTSTNGVTGTLHLKDDTVTLDP